MADNKPVQDRRGYPWSATIVCLLSLAWLIACLIYLDTVIGLDIINELMPNELGAIVTAVALPLLVLWLVYFALLRRQDFARHTASLEAQLQRLT